MNKFVVFLFVGVVEFILELSFCVEVIKENKLKFEVILKDGDEYESLFF